MKNIGATLRRIREGFGITREELGKKLLVNHRLIERYEKNITMPKIDFLQKVCSEFNVDLSCFLQEQKCESKSKDLIVKENNGKHAIFDKQQKIYLTPPIYDGVLLSDFGLHVVYNLGAKHKTGIRYSAVVNNFGHIKTFEDVIFGVSCGFYGDACPAFCKKTNLVHLVDKRGEILSKGFSEMFPVDSNVNFGIYYGGSYKKWQKDKTKGFALVEIINYDGFVLNLTVVKDDNNAFVCKEFKSIDVVCKYINRYGPKILPLVGEDVYKRADNYFKILNLTNNYLVTNFGESTNILYAINILEKNVYLCKNKTNQNFDFTKIVAKTDIQKDIISQQIKNFVEKINKI